MSTRWVQRRTVDCPTCKTRSGRPCVRLGDADAHPSLNVPPHAARLRAEAELSAAKKAAKDALRAYARTRERLAP